MERIPVSLGALALLAAQVTVFAQPQTGSLLGESKATILGPEAGLLALSPVVLLYERATGLEAEAEPGRLFTVGTLPAPSGSQPRLLRFSAAGASAYRLHLEDVALPEGARMYFYGIDASGKVTRTFGPYEKSGPLADGSFRSRVVPGMEVVLEIQGMGEGPWPLRIPRVSAIDAAMLAELESANDPGLTETAAQRQPPRGQRVEVEVDGKVVRAEIVENEVVLEGDIVLGPAADLSAGKSDGGRSRFAVMRTESSGRWSGGVIPFDGALRNDPRVVAAMQSWTQRTNGVITFVPRSNESSFMRFSSTSGNICSSGVGRASGARTINVAQPCPTGTLIHEIGHALGFHHEQSREDRDNFVRIIWENIQDDRDHNFEKAAGDANSDLGGYDFGSIMHYPLTAFSTNGERTIEPKVPIPAGVTPGQRSAPSTGDVRALNIQYGVLVSKSNFQVTAAGGTFTVNVTAPSDRFWVVTDDAAWVSVISGGQGTGNGTIQFRVLPNEMVLSSLAVVAPGPRTARLRIALTPALQTNATVEIVQAPPGCNFTVSPSRISAPAQGGAFPVTVTTSPGCTWGASESLTWVSMSALSGQGSTTVSVRLSANNQVNKLGVSPRRTGTIQVAGKAVAIEQEGVDTLP